MKFRTSHETLAASVAWVARSLPTKPPTPILGGLLLETRDNTLTVSGFDYDTSNQTTINVDTTDDARVVVSGRLLATITKALPKGDVEFVADGQSVTITAGRARFTLPLMPADAYPPLPAMPISSGFIGADDFTDAITQVGIAAGRDDTIPMLTGIRIETDGNLLTFAATDRFRLAVRTAEWSPDVLDLVPAVLVPGRSLIDAAKGVGAGDVGLGFGDGILGVRCGNRRTTMRLLDVEFVKYRTLLPTTHTTGVDVPINELTDAIKRSALVTNNGQHIRLTINEGTLSLSAGTDTDGASNETMQVETDGPDITIAFNPTYLIDGLGVLTGDTARLEFTTPTRPALLTSPNNPEYRCIVMPARIP